LFDYDRYGFELKKAKLFAFSLQFSGAEATLLITPLTKGFHATLLTLSDNLVPLWNPTFFKN
jgi:hypothetical protein